MTTNKDAWRRVLTNADVCRYTSSCMGHEFNAAFYFEGCKRNAIEVCCCNRNTIRNAMNIPTYALKPTRSIGDRCTALRPWPMPPCTLQHPLLHPSSWGKCFIFFPKNKNTWGHCVDLKRHQAHYRMPTTTPKRQENNNNVMLICTKHAPRPISKCPVSTCGTPLPPRFATWR